MKKGLTEVELFVINKAKELRTSEGYSQSKLSILLGLASGFVGKVESDKTTSKYNLEHINLLAKIFNVSPKEFLPENPL